LLPIEDDIQALIEGCVKNDRRAQELLYKKFYAAMAALCARYISNEQDAMQVLNDGFLKVFKNIHSFDATKAAIYTWIRKIMINTTISFLRKQPIVYASDISVMDQEATIENSIIQKLDADELLSIIKKLPKATQLVFNLYTVDGFNHREIAEMLGISEGTSKWHVSEARKQLKQSIMKLQKIS
jgi:RNA polymerase sigma factor (sigma-70 family)